MQATERCQRTRPAFLRAGGSTILIVGEETLVVCCIWGIGTERIYVSNPERLMWRLENSPDLPTTLCLRPRGNSKQGQPGFQPQPLCVQLFSEILLSDAVLSIC